MGIILSPMQNNAKKKTIMWYEISSEQVFTISGVAGSGKSTIVSAIIDELGLQQFQVAFCTFTGKAALVLNQKGNRATTIHKLIYDTQVQNIKDKDGIYRKVAINTKKTQLSSLLRLIVIDEAYMVAKHLIKDLMSYGIKILLLGDNGQLKPIGEDNGYFENPDVLLTEIHRQAADNPIIYLSELARLDKLVKWDWVNRKAVLNGHLTYGMLGNKVAIIPKDDIEAGYMLRADQVLCGKNDTRKLLNQEIRDELGFSGTFPQVGEKIICIKNNWDKEIKVEGVTMNLINGMTGQVIDEPYKFDKHSRTHRLGFQPDGATEYSYFPDILADSEDFKLDYPTPVNHKTREMIERDEKINKFDFGYAITTHKAQGSQWNKVFVYYEHIYKQHEKWSYTAITRAADKLILAI